MGLLKYLMLHCSATPEGRNITEKEIEHMHKIVNQWDRVGYQRLYKLDGSCYIWVKEDGDNVVDPFEVTYGAGPLNAVAFHWCYAGGMNKEYTKAKDTRTMQQKEKMAIDLLEFIKIHPTILICGHYEFANKACPSFDVAKWCKEIGVPEINIYKK